MADPVAVELKGVSKVFPAGRGSQRITAVNTMYLQILRGEFFTFLGPSGCGKTTTLRMIAGFENPTVGEIAIAGEPMNAVPANKRPVNTVFQNYALFPHLNVGQNVGFGLKIKRVAAPERERRVKEALELVRMGGYENRRTTQLSGGQQQRIALARALINEPTVLLLDEPLGALDLKLRKEVQLELKQLQTQLGITFIYVTHDQEEALTMSDRIAVMHNGVIQQMGAPREIYERPSNRFVADFIGETNFLNGRIRQTTPTHRLIVANSEIAVKSPETAVSLDQAVTLAIRPEKVNLYPQGTVADLQANGLTPTEIRRLFQGDVPAASGTVGDYLQGEGVVALKGSVAESIYIGTDIRYKIVLANEESLIVRVQNLGGRYDTRFKLGDAVYVVWQPHEAQILTS
jgi:spermidine/putrescine transport system ATP-binding protein